MKKILFAVLTLSLLLALCACGDTGAAEPAGLKGKTPAEGELPLGVLTQGADETRYENEYLGFGCRLDGNWYVADEEQLAQLAGISMDVYEGTKYEEAMRNAQVFYDLYAESMELPGTINLNFTQSSIPAGTTAEQYLSLAEKQMKQALEAGGIQNVEVERRTVTFAGSETEGLWFYGMNQGVKYYGLQVYFTTGGHFATLTLGTFGADKTEALLELFYPLS